MPQLDTLQTIKEIGHNIGFGAAPIAITTGNHIANIITIISAMALVLPKLADMVTLFLNIFKKNNNNAPIN